MMNAIQSFSSQHNVFKIMVMIFSTWLYDQMISERKRINAGVGSETE